MVFPSLDVSNATISGNSVVISGDGINNEDVVTIASSIVADNIIVRWGNAIADGADPSGNVDYSSGGNNLSLI